MITGYTTNGLAIYGTAADFPWDADRWPNFSPDEFDCKGTGRIALDPASLDKLQALRTEIGKPFVIVSGYRSPEHNSAVGGVADSKHKEGIAFDVSMEGHDRKAVFAAAERLGFMGLGKYATFMHMDTRPKPARWGSW